MNDRDRLRHLATAGDVPAARALAREQLRSPVAEDEALLGACEWWKLRAECRNSFDAWRKFAAMVLISPDADDYAHLSSTTSPHLFSRNDADIMDTALGRIRPLLTIPEPFSIRGKGRRR